METEFVSTTLMVIRRVIVIQVILETVVIFRVRVSIRIRENHVTVEVSVRMTVLATLHRVLVMLGMFSLSLFPSLESCSNTHITDSLEMVASSAALTLVRDRVHVKYSRHMTVIW